MQTDRSKNKLKTARWQGAPIPALVILVQTQHAAPRPAAASLPLCPRNYGRGLVMYA